MQSAATGFVNALRWGSTLIAARITVYVNGKPTSVVLPVSDADFVVDRNSEFRRHGQLTLEVLPTVPPQTVTANNTSYTLLPLTQAALLAPFGNEVFVEMSVVQAGATNTTAGANGWVPLGLFQIATAVVEDSGDDLTMTLELYDRSWAIAQRKLLTAYTVPAASGDLQSELQALLSTTWGTAPPWSYNIATSTYTVPAGTYNQGEDPWQVALDIFSSAGYELYFDVNGNIVGAPTPNPSTSPVVWNFAEGEVADRGTLAHPITGTPYTTPVDITMTMTRDGIANNFYVSATGPNNAAGTAQPVQVNASDNNSGSPTYVNGPMGNIPTFIYDSLITTAAQAQAEANNDLAVALAKAWTISIATPPNPLFDINDVCTATRSRLGLNNQKFVVDTITTSIRYDVDTVVSGRVVNS